MCTTVTDHVNDIEGFLELAVKCHLLAVHCSLSILQHELPSIHLTPKAFTGSTENLTSQSHARDWIGRPTLLPRYVYM